MEARELESTFDRLREMFLAYDASDDSSGEKWDALRVAYDREFLELKAAVEDFADRFIPTGAIAFEHSSAYRSAYLEAHREKP